MKLSSKVNRRLQSVDLIAILVIGICNFVLIKAKPTTSSSSSEAPDTTTIWKDETGKERQFDFNREKYDPYDAQASAIAFRRYKEAQSTKGRYSNAAKYEDPLMASASNVDQVFEQKLYDPFFYYNGPKHQPQNPNLNNHENQRSGRYSRLEDPKYFPRLVQSLVPAPAGVRNRRNTATSSGLTNNLLAEDVYFFRRDPTLAGKAKQRLDEYEKSPYFYRESDPQSADMLARYRGKPISTTAFFNPSSKNYNDYYVSRIPQPVSSRQNTIMGERPYYSSAQYAPNQIYDNYIDGPRIPLLPGGRDTTQAGVPGINGWTVQVGTQLQVHDDGRTRNPNRYYVRDERPHPIARYPHYRDRQ